MATTHWSNQTANWNTPANWSNGLPDFSRAAVFDFPGTYAVTVDSAVQAGGVNLKTNGATLHEAATGSIACDGTFTVATGTAILEGANAFNRVVLSGGTTVAGSANAFGISAIAFAGAHPLLSNTVTLALQNDLKATLGGTIAAAHGTKFTVGGDAFTWETAATLSFGTAGRDGTVVLHGTTATGTGAGIFINSGTLADDATGFGNILDSVDSVTLAAGANLKLNASATVHFLSGEGHVSGGEGVVLTMHRSLGFGGVISGKMGVTVDGVASLAGTNTYIGPTVVKTTDPGDIFGGQLTIAEGGSLAPESEIILDDANLHISQSGVYVLDNLISGLGVLHQEGGGTIVLTHANTFAGDIRPKDGIVEADNPHATGTARVTLQGGTFLSTVNMTLGGQFWSEDGGTFAVAAGKTVTTSDTGFYLVVGGTLTFGSQGNTGTVVWRTAPGSESNGTNDIKIAFGTLEVGDDQFVLLDNPLITGTSIGKHGKLEIDGHAIGVFNLSGAGKISNDGAAADLTIDGGNFRGSFNGAIHPIVEDAVHLKGGLGNFSAAIGVSDGAVLKLAGTSAHDITFLHDAAAGASVALTLNAVETGVLSGFGTTDTLDFLGLASASADTDFDFNPNPATGGVLTVSDGVHSQSIELVGDYQSVAFFTGDDGSGGTSVFIAGMRPPPEPAFAENALAAHDMARGHAYTGAHGDFI